MGGGYYPGVLAPLLPINGFCYYRVLEKLELLDYYTEHFEKPSCKLDDTSMLESSPKVARFFWGEGGIVPTIDEMNERFGKEEEKVIVCPIRFSIGAILFERKLWEDMHYFNVGRFWNRTGMGSDEIQICTYCMMHSRPIMVSENIVAGHFSFRKQYKAMEEFYISHREYFV